jgi:signal peptidase I
VNAGESTTKSFPGIAAPPAERPALPSDSAPTVAAPATRELIRLRWALIAVMLGLVALVVVRLWMVEGLLLRRVTIEGPSMAPTFLGAHYHVTCDDCRFPFACDATDVPASGRVVCPNCGFRDSELHAENLRAGEAVLIDRWKAWWQRPQRGDVVAVRQPDQPDDLLIKRIAALPGERLEIRGGDLHVGGQIVRKSLREFRASRVLVHDNAFVPSKSPNLPARWQPADSNSRWETVGSALHIAPAANAAAPWDWLEYHHLACTQTPAPRTRLVPILDNDSFNQNQSRQLNEVRDAMLTCRVQIEGPGRLALTAIDGSDRFEVVLDTSQRQIALLKNGAPELQVPVAAEALRGQIDIEFGLCDQQVLLSLAGRPLVQHAYERTNGPKSEVLHPLAIGASGLNVQLSNLRVWRDIYYLEPRSTSRPWQAEKALASDQYALLGDNPPVSIDVRHWPGSGGTPRFDFLGPVERPFWATAR